MPSPLPPSLPLPTQAPTRPPQLELSELREEFTARLGALDSTIASLRVDKEDLLAQLGAARAGAQLGSGGVDAAEAADLQRRLQARQRVGNAVKTLAQGGGLGTPAACAAPAVRAFSTNR